MATSPNEAKILISQAVLMDLFFGKNEAVLNLFEQLLRSPQPFMPYLTDRAMARYAETLGLLRKAPEDLQSLDLQEEAATGEALLDVLPDQFLILEVDLSHLQAALEIDLSDIDSLPDAQASFRQSWFGLENAVDYAVATANQLDAVIILEFLEEITPTGELVREARLRLEYTTSNFIRWLEESLDNEEPLMDSTPEEDFSRLDDIGASQLPTTQGDEETVTVILIGPLEVISGSGFQKLLNEIRNHGIFIDKIE